MFIRFNNVNYFVSPDEKTIMDIVNEIWLRSNEKTLSPDKKRQLVNIIIKTLNENKITI